VGCDRLFTHLNHAGEAEIPGAVVPGAQSGHFAGLVAAENDGGCPTAVLHHERVAERRPQTDWFVPPDSERQLSGLRHDGERAVGLAALIVPRESRPL
jgi:hypothetical protein